MAWLNSDDKYTPWVFQLVSEIFSQLPEVEWITTLYPLQWNREGIVVSCPAKGGFTRQTFLKGENLPSHNRYAIGCIQQESVFWRRSLWERAGGYVDSTYQLAADFELWARFFQHTELYTVEVPLGGFRSYGDQKSVNYYDLYLQEAEEILQKYGGQKLNELQSILISMLKRYIRLPYSIRRLMVKLKLKSPHYQCAYHSQNKQWIIEKI